MAGNIAITQGEHAVATAPGTTISTLLGSCVACCLWDPESQIGGMNHILLALKPNCPELTPNLTALNAMELLINDMIKRGAARNRLKAKAFGGARMVKGLSDIGSQNGVFLLGFLEREGISCVSQSLGGELARHIIFTPTTGAVRMKMRQAQVEERLPETTTAGNGLEMF